ncbi:hypothetical protein XpopCFBP1817_17355 [Xanthomonas populi]|uniref:Uncharacterized protein n=1 Tax=Xanthomonas populi TaxID=53414 RepID=A0A2S7EFL1_9XANT|nr:hypothetical protein XpopCFBP1817_17355 [Xanthomonas populi]
MSADAYDASLLPLGEAARRADEGRHTTRIIQRCSKSNALFAHSTNARKFTQQFRPFHPSLAALPMASRHLSLRSGASLNARARQETSMRAAIHRRSPALSSGRV